MSKLAIYVIYDRENIVDRYIGYFLKGLIRETDELIVVCSMPEIKKGIENILPYADQIIYRDNVGFDIGAYKDVILNDLGWEYVRKYDELMLINDSFFGPFYCMQDMFQEMEKKKVDFWGITKKGKCLVNHALEQEHINSYFLCIQRKMLHSIDFQNYIEQLPYYKTFLETVDCFEKNFTSFFSSLGFTYDTYINPKNAVDVRYNFNEYFMLPDELLIKKKNPFLKRKLFEMDFPQSHSQENLKKALDYIDKETDYDVNMIWEHVIRTMSLDDLQRTLHLRYIIDEKKSAENFSLSEDMILMIVVNQVEKNAYLQEYVKRIQGTVAIIFCSSKAECLKYYRRNGYQTFEISDQKSMKHLYTLLCTYEYIGIVNEVDMSGKDYSNCYAKSLLYSYCENMFADKNYVEQIYSLFLEHIKLGLILPVESIHGDELANLGQDFSYKNYENYWIRKRIFEKYFDEECFYKNKWVVLAKSLNYYSAFVESKNYAEMYENMLTDGMRRIIKSAQKGNTVIHSIDDITRTMFLYNLRAFEQKYKKIYVYGIGGIAKKYVPFLHGIRAFIVSDGHKYIDYFADRPVLEFSEVLIDDDCGIVLCLNENNQKQVMEQLELKGIKNYLCI